MAKKIPMSDRLYVDKKENSEFAKKLKQLTDASSLPAYLGELLLTEIRLSTDEANLHLRERAKILGLM